jgi:hypothetical protein
MDALSIVTKSSAILGLAVAVIETIDIVVAATGSTAYIVGIVPVLILAFGAVYIATRAFGSDTPHTRKEAYATGAGIMMLGFLGATLVPTAIFFLLPLSILLVAAAVILAFAADALAQRYERA